MHAKPRSVSIAVTIIWGSIMLSLLLSLLSVFLKLYPEGQFLANAVGYTLIGIIPWQLQKRKSWARHAYGILMVLSGLVLVLGYTQELSAIEKVASYLAFPLECYACWLLFREDANIWYSTSTS